MAIGFVFMVKIFCRIFFILVVVFWNGFIVEGWLWDLILNVNFRLFFKFMILVFFLGFIKMCFFLVGKLFSRGWEFL